MALGLDPSISCWILKARSLSVRDRSVNIARIALRFAWVASCSWGIVELVRMLLVLPVLVFVSSTAATSTTSAGLVLVSSWEAPSLLVSIMSTSEVSMAIICNVYCRERSTWVCFVFVSAHDLINKLTKTGF